MGFNEWNSVKLCDVIQFNPRENIKKNEIVKKVSMDKLEPFNRKITGCEEVPFTSGTKFRNGDTLLARITPCLENGKTAQVDILKDDEVAFGSTEFIILREKVGVTDNNFIYYLSISPEFRNIAIKSMTGTSGRQRVQKDVLEQSEIKIPPLNEQKAIAHILSTLDEKIAVNNEINKKLEEMAQGIFKQWFVDFEFPNEEGKLYKSSGGEMVESEIGMIPKGWKVSKLSEISNLTMGLSPKSSSYNTNKIGIPLLNGASDFENGLINAQKYTTEPNKICSKNDLIFCVRATIGNITFADKEYCLGRGVASITPQNNKFIGLLYYNLLMSINRLIANATGSVFLSLSKPSINNLKLIIPNEKILEEFSTLINNVLDYKHTNQLEIQKLKNTRDLLLPRLISGEIRV